MQAVALMLRLLVAVTVIDHVVSQEGFSEQDLLRLRQLASNDGQVDTINSYNTNVIQRDPLRNEHSISSVNVQYQLTDANDQNNDYNRDRQGRSDRRKVFRIKNPFQRQLESNENMEDGNTLPQDNNPGASNQYPAMQYSLPPEDFIQKMRAENHYLQQMSTPSPLFSYTATPQSQFQYPTNPSNGYDNNQNQVDNRGQQSPTYPSNAGSYQYASSYSLDNAQSTPSPMPPYLSTENNQYSGTATNSYVSSSSPMYLSSQPSIQQYISSPISVTQTGTPDYSNRVSTPNINTISYDSNEQNKALHIDHYDNSANGIRYPTNNNQYLEYPSSTPAPSNPSSTPFPENMHDSWQNGVNSLSKSMQDYSINQFQNSPYNNNNNQQVNRPENHQDNPNSDTHRIGITPAANSLYLDYAQPDYQNYNSLRSRTRELEQESNPQGYYSNGDYGWKMNEKKSIEGYPSVSTPHYQTYGGHSDASAVSQMNFYLDASKPQFYDQISKSSSEQQDAQEFAKAAAKAHENLKQKQHLAKLTESYFAQNGYAPNYNTNNLNGNSHNQQNVVTSYYGNNDRFKHNQFADSSNTNQVVYGNSQELITASPYYFGNSKDNGLESKIKLPFDHANALKNIVPIDVSNVLGSEGSAKSINLDGNANRFHIPNFSKEQMDSFKQYYRPVTETYYKDKNSGYGYNIKTKLEELSSPESLKSSEQNLQLYAKHYQQESPFGQSLSDNRNYGDSQSQQINYMPSSNFQNSISGKQNVQQSNQRPNQMQSDFTSILKLNDIPYRLTQGLSGDTLRLNNNNFDQNSIPTPIPTKINQNVGSHQLDVANNILAKLLQNKQQGITGNSNRPESEIQSTGLMSTINGFRVANPFNVDLKLVADMLKGKPTIDDSQMISLRDQFNKPAPLKLDMSSLQQLLMKNENYGSLASLSDGLSTIGNPYADIFSSGRPYQGVKYSRSQEEEENIPIADASNAHPIGAVVEQDDSLDVREVSEGTDIAETQSEFESRPKNIYTREQKLNDRHRHPNAVSPNRHVFSRKLPKSDIEEPYPLLKPPPPNQSRTRSSSSGIRSIKNEKRNRRRRVNRPKYARILNTEPLFEGESSPVEEVDTKSPAFFRSTRSESKSDVEEEISSSA